MTRQKSTPAVRRFSLHRFWAPVTGAIFARPGRKPRLALFSLAGSPMEKCELQKRIGQWNDEFFALCCELQRRPETFTPEVFARLLAYSERIARGKHALGNPAR
ncbi:MAG: hypothetical protein JO041_13135 [Acidobacteria bacterium]|nr:hypothetical protein [Acidobacteriota bacterium]